MAFCRSTLICLGLLVVVTNAAAGAVSKIAEMDRALNSSISGFAWVTAIDEEELEKGKVSLLDNGEGNDGGFSSLDGMLQWAIGHSDPSKLKNEAESTKRMTPEELSKRRSEIKEFMEKFKMPSDAEFMKIAIKDLQNSSLVAEDRQRALNELLELVEPIDNANDLDKLGGLSTVVMELERSEEELRATAAWILGKACQNNHVVQSQIVHLGALRKLMNMAMSSNENESLRAVYAISAVIRNYPYAQQTFYEEGGEDLLQKILSNSNSTLKLRKKCLILYADLAEQQAELVLKSYEPHVGVLKSIVALTSDEDLDTQEKALMALRSLAHIDDRTKKVLKEVCNVEVALEVVRMKFEGLFEDENLSEVAHDLEKLRQEVVSSM